MKNSKKQKPQLVIPKHKPFPKRLMSRERLEKKAKEGTLHNAGVNTVKEYQECSGVRLLSPSEIQQLYPPERITQLMQQANRFTV